MVSPPLAKNMSTYASTYPSLAGIMVAAAAVMAVVSEAVTSEDTVVAMEAVTLLDL